MSHSNAEKNGVFINGKKQVVELLQMMDSSDKAKLLKNLKVKNPTLARELAETCLSFEGLWDLHDECLKTLVSQIKPAILGLALSISHVKNQRRALSLVPREVALKAFEIMQKDLSSNRSECLRAQQKILELAIGLNKNKIISLY